MRVELLLKPKEVDLLGPISHVKVVAQIEEKGMTDRVPLLKEGLLRLIEIFLTESCRSLLVSYELLFAALRGVRGLIS